jgi:hypothetical protein
VNSRLTYVPRIAVILLTKLHLTAEEALASLIKLGRNVFVEPNMSSNGPKFDVERLSTSIRGILKGHGLDETTKLIENVVNGGQTYAYVHPNK